MFSFAQKYAHRHHEDGTYDAICPICARTVGRHLSEVKLAVTESIHKCPGLSPSVIDRMAREYRMNQVSVSYR
jgi:hypothetical protein